MSMSINNSVDLIKQCKGNWLSVEHYILPKIPMKDNEKYGYCSICWENDFKECNFGPRQEPLHKSLNFKQCGEDTL